MKRNEGVSMITLIITIIVIIILAAIAFVGMDDATGSAQYARFSSEFGDYATNFTGSAVTKVQESLGLAGKVANKSQIIYCAARGVNLSEFDEVLNSVTLPGGYTSEKFQTAIKDATGATYVLADSNTPCYEIKDDVMKEYKGKSFYGNSNGLETHWVTASGKVFTLPGYPRTVDGEERMYISADLYYVPENGEMILASELDPFKAKKIGDKTSGATIGSQEYTDAADHAGEGGNTETAKGELLASVAAVGDYVNYPVTYTNVENEYGDVSPYTGWRVLSVNLDGTVNLVSAGVPLTFYHPDESDVAAGMDVSVATLTTDFLETSFTTTGNRGYIKCGFATKDLKSVFNNKYIASVRSVTYEDIQEDFIKVRSSTYWVDALPDSSFHNVGNVYWLPSASGLGGLYNVWWTSIGGCVGGAEYGVRPVVTLKPTVLTTGQDASGAWNIDI